MCVVMTSTTSIIWHLTTRLGVLGTCCRNYAKCPLGGGEVEQNPTACSDTHVMTLDLAAY